MKTVNFIHSLLNYLGSKNDIFSLYLRHNYCKDHNYEKDINIPSLCYKP